MKRWLFDLLRDPVDGSPLSLVESDELRSSSGRSYPIRAGIPRFVATDAYVGSFGYQWKRFARTQLDSQNGTTRSRDRFVECTGWDPESLRGKTVLDVGCGMGRFAEVAAAAGARVVGVDLSSAVEPASANLARFSDAAVVQADVFALPFAAESFDAVYSLGVLHHTPDTRKAFLRLPPLVKRGGRIAIWVYARELERSMRMSRFYRPLTTRLPRRWLLSLARAAAPLGELQRRRVGGRLLRGILPVSRDPDPEWRILDTFDWYSPRYQWTHTCSEVKGWFREAGLSEIRSGPFPVSVAAVRA